MSEVIYADHAATTAVTPEVLRAMLPYFCEDYGNPSGVYSVARRARQAVDAARSAVAAALGARREEIFFTSGGSEADNWAIRGVAHALAGRGRHLITTRFEHHAVLHTMRALEKEGFSVTYLPVGKTGVVRPADLVAALTPDTTLVSVMYANNEIGTIQPIPELAGICRERGVLFHTDAVQAVGHLPIDVADQCIDLLSLSAHKFHGPKGVGALYIRNGVKFPNLIEGGAQERGRRAGTENVPGIVGLGAAVTAACRDIPARAEKTRQLRDRLIDGLLALPDVRLNGDRERRLPGNVNVTCGGVEGESLLLLLDMAGICASSGSACTVGSLDPSHVLLAVGCSGEEARGSLRLTLGEENTEAEVDRMIETVARSLARLRALRAGKTPE